MNETILTLIVVFSVANMGILTARFFFWMFPDVITENREKAKQ